MQFVLPTVSVLAQNKDNDELVEIQFKDKAMYYEMIDLLDSRVKQRDDNEYIIKITQEDLRDITDLDVTNNEIYDISGIEKFTGLYELTIDGENIKDISMISVLSNLENLDLYDNKISDLSPLSELENLEILNMTFNEITDISPLSGLTNLKELNLSSNRIKDISAISGLENLEKLEIDTNQIKNINAVSGLTNLKYLNAAANQIKDINALSGISSIENLYLHKNKISDASAIDTLDNLDSYNLNDQKIEIKTNLKAIDLPQIFIAAKNSESKLYMGDNSDYKLTDCTISEDGTKVILNKNAINARVQIENGTILDTAGEYEITATYEGQTVSFNISVKEIAVESIEITKGPDKTEYIEGESFDPTGMEVVAIYNNGEREVIEEYEIEPAGPLSLEDTVVTIKYEGKETTLEIGENGIIIKPKPDEDIIVEIDDDLEIEKDGDLIYIKNLQPKTLISKVLEKIRTNGEIQVYDKEQNKEEDYTKYATSDMRVRIVKGEKQIEYILVVRGDTNGDGDANFSDMLKMNKHRLNKVKLEGAYYKAGDIDGNNIVNFSDILKVNKYRLKKVSEL